MRLPPFLIPARREDFFLTYHNQPERLQGDGQTGFLLQAVAKGQEFATALTTPQEQCLSAWMNERLNLSLSVPLRKSIWRPRSKRMGQNKIPNLATNRNFLGQLV